MTCYGDETHEDLLDSPAQPTEAAPPAGTPSPFDALTPTQLQFAIGLAMGQTAHEIGERLGCAPKTADSHRGSVLRRLKLENCVQLARLAIAAGIVPAPTL